MKKLLLLPCLFIAITSMAQTKLTIQNPKELCTSVINNPPAQTDDTDLTFEAEGIGTRQEIRMGDGFIVRGLLYIDLSAIPIGSFVNWARLTLFGNVMSGFNSSKLRRVTSHWAVDTVNWNTQPSTTKRGQVSLPNSTSRSEDYKNINVTNLVQAMVDSPATSFGFELSLDTEYSTKIDQGFNFIQFKGPQNGKTHLAPKLVVEFTTPGFQKQETTLSIDLSGASTEMSIYPNPCHGIFNCNIKSVSTDNMTLRVIDMLGRTVYDQPVNTSGSQMQVNLPSSSSGTYFAILQDNKGATLVSQQLQVN